MGIPQNVYISVMREGGKRDEREMKRKRKKNGALKGEFWASEKNARRSQGESSNTSNTHQKHSQQLSSRVVGLLHLFLSRSGHLSFGWKINSH